MQSGYNLDAMPTNHGLKSCESRIDIRNGNQSEMSNLTLSLDLLTWDWKDKFNPYSVPILEGMNSPTHADWSHITRAYSQNTPELLLWHQRLGHRNIQEISKLLNMSTPVKPCFCEACVGGKSTRMPLYTREEPHFCAPRPGYLFHVDTVGPFRVTTLGGGSYITLLVDDYSRFIFPILTADTSFFEDFKRFNARLKAEFGRDKVIAQIHGDSATYFEKHYGLREYCQTEGIVQLFSPPYTQELNNVVGRYVRTVFESARCMMIHANAPPSLLGEALVYSTYILNRLPLRRDKAGRCPLELWTGRRQQNAFQDCKIFGCASYIHNDHGSRGPKPSKEEPKVKHDNGKPRKYIFTGIDENHQAFRLAELPYYTLTRSAHVIFNEEDFPCRNNKTTVSEIKQMVIPFIEGTNENLSRSDLQPIQDNQTVRPVRKWTPSAAGLQSIASEADLANFLSGYEHDTISLSHLQQLSLTSQEKEEGSSYRPYFLQPEVGYEQTRLERMEKSYCFRVEIPPRKFYLRTRSRKERYTSGSNCHPHRRRFQDQERWEIQVSTCSSRVPYEERKGLQRYICSCWKRSNFPCLICCRNEIRLGDEAGRCTHGFPPA